MYWLNLTNKLKIMCKLFLRNTGTNLVGSTENISILKRKDHSKVYT